MCDRQKKEKKKERLHQQQQQQPQQQSLSSKFFFAQDIDPQQDRLGSAIFVLYPFIIEWLNFMLAVNLSLSQDSEQNIWD